MFLRVISVVSVVCCISMIIHTTNVAMKLYQCRRHHYKKDDIVAYDTRHHPIYRRECLLAGKAQEQDPPLLLIAIPTLYRRYRNKEAFYIDRTLRSLIEPLTSRQKDKIKIVIVLTDKEYSRRDIVYRRVHNLVQHHVTSGLVDIVAPPLRYYRDLSSVDRDNRQGDGLSRVLWRSQQSLDYSFTISYARNYCQYFLLVEDDVTVTSNYYDVIERHVTEGDIPLHLKPRWLPYFSGPIDPADDTRLGGDSVPWPVEHNTTWLSMSFYKMGYVGVLFPVHVLPFMSFVHDIFYFAYAVDLTHQSFAYFNFRQYVGREHLFVHHGNQSSSLGTV